MHHLDFVSGLMDWQCVTPKCSRAFVKQLVCHILLR